MIDIWHFVLSEYLVLGKGDKAAVAAAMARDWVAESSLTFDGKGYRIAALDIRQQLELLTALAAVRRLHLPLVAHLFNACDLPPAVLYRDYVSKNVLNHFRQDRGYKSGAYKKFWNGHEDNVHMAEILLSLTAADEQLPTALYGALAQRYHEYGAAGKLA